MTTKAEAQLREMLKAEREASASALADALRQHEEALRKLTEAEAEVRSLQVDLERSRERRQALEMRAISAEKRASFAEETARLAEARLEELEDEESPIEIFMNIFRDRLAAWRAAHAEDTDDDR